MASSKSTSIWTRKRDLVYLGFFFTHVPIMLMVDIVPFYPEAIRSDVLVNIRQFYIETFRDKFFETPPNWFMFFLAMELVYHLPLSIWAVGALIREDPLVPVHLLIWAVQSFITTMTSLVDVWSWTDRTTDEKYNITTLYGPYALLAAFMGFDMFLRLRSLLVGKIKNA
ncbi:hypothetical protein DTO166G4_3106 [Paecilomyces variotii]|nr:hypothetical protein DTO164E3_8332 [Paecilomyces variotii]KAJ9206203.1 hypothetical protein DTO032I3_2068 [Paecilomyces variotii]KAJ9215221.1 hypothetical protein DTO166G4_3106 [Paecilomyces variotii]KAJ9231652.1 hypothetical protein DTO166G5_6710 [Paecilomyces variotii]KAJ9252515.1 hypothetical protein DTO195F2_7432 [Paecilomyces variotii]